MSARDCSRTTPSSQRDRAPTSRYCAKPTSRGKRLVYLDSAATSQKPQAVIDALVDYYAHVQREHPSRRLRDRRAGDGCVRSGARQSRAASSTREPREIIWTRNTTEAINLVAYSWGIAEPQARRRDPDHAARTSFEPRALAAAGGKNRRGAALHSGRRTRAATCSTISTACWTGASSSRSRT